jgi:hypothetical protein
MSQYSVSTHGFGKSVRYYTGAFGECNCSHQTPIKINVLDISLFDPNTPIALEGGM